MDREMQINLLVAAEKRAKAIASAWLCDGKVREALRRNHEHARRLREEGQRSSSRRG